MTRELRWVRASLAIALMCSCLRAGPSSADHELDIYGFDDVFVFDVLGRGGRIINLVCLQDSLDLAIAGQATTGAHFGLSSYGHHQESLLVSFHDRVEIYDVSDRSRPLLQQTVSLLDDAGHHLQWPKIAKVGVRYFVVSAQPPRELTPGAKGTGWSIRPAEDPPVIARQDVMMSRFPDFDHSRRYEWPFVVLTTDQFRYEVGWRVRRSGSYRMHEKFLWKVRITDGLIVSSLRLGETVETFGE